MYSLHFVETSTHQEFQVGSKISIAFTNGTLRLLILYQSNKIDISIKQVN